MTTRKIYKIEGMECPSCAMKLEAIEDRLPGISSIEASYRRGQMVVEFDEAVISEGQIMNEAQRLGYIIHIDPRRG